MDHGNQGCTHSLGCKLRPYLSLPDSWPRQFNELLCLLGLQTIHLVCAEDKMDFYLSVLLTNLSSNFAVAEISTKAHYVFLKKKDNAPQTL